DSGYTSVHFKLARYISESVPNVKLNIIQDEGHFFIKD
ncbi:unnamed protein product, partial [marine sediment metagenome]